MQNRNKIIRMVISIAMCLATVLILAQTIGAKAQNNKPAKERLVTINDNGLYFTIKTSKELVSEILFDLKLYLKPEDRIYPSLSEKAQTHIIIHRATPVAILADNKSHPVNTFQETVGQAIQETKITLGPDDEINYDLEDPLFSDIEIIVTRVKFGEITRNLSIPFQTIHKKDNDLLWGKTEVRQTGKNGIKKQVYKIIYKDGKENQRILEKEEIVENPQNKIVVQGTKVVVGKPYFGIASYYRYGNQLTCASTQFSKGTKLRVTNTQNGKHIIVTVNDYGPFVPGRIIDLNIPAFEKIAPLGAGVIKVKVEKIIQ